MVEDELLEEDWLVEVVGLDDEEDDDDDDGA